MIVKQKVVDSKPEKPKKAEKTESTNKKSKKTMLWVLFACLCLLSLSAVLLGLGWNQETTSASNPTVLWNKLKLKTGVNKKSAEINETPTDAPSVLYDFFYIKDEPELNQKGEFRLADFEGNILEGTTITGPSNYTYLDVYEKLFFADLIIGAENFWVLMSSDPVISVTNNKYFSEAGDQVDPPSYAIDNTLSNRHVDAQQEAFQMALNVDKGINTLMQGSTLELPGPDTDFGIFSHALDQFEVTVSIRGGLINQKQNEDVKIQAENIVSQNDNDFVIDIPFKGGSRPLKYGSDLTNNFSFKARIRVARDFDPQGNAIYKVTQLPIPESALIASNVFAWNLPITIDKLSILTKYDREGLIVQLQNILNSPEEIELTYDSASDQFNLPRYYSASSPNAIYPYSYPDIGDDGITPLKHSAVYKNAKSPYVWSEMKKLNKIIRVKILLSIRGTFVEVEDYQVGKSRRYYSDGFTLQVGAWIFYIRFDNAGTSNEEMHILFVSNHNIADTRLISFKFALDDTI